MLIYILDDVVLFLLVNVRFVFVVIVLWDDWFMRCGYDVVENF